MIGFTADLPPVFGRPDEHPDVVTGERPEMSLEACSRRRIATVDA